MAEKNDLTRTILGALFIVALMGISLWILLPFLAAIIWAVTIVAATWPLMITIQSWLWGRRGLAVTVMTLILLAVLVVPLSAAIGVIATHTDTIIGWAKSLAHYEITAAPDWLRRLPFVGFPAAEAWDKIAASGLRGILDKAWPYTGAVVKWFLSQMGDLGALFVQFLLTVVIAALLYTNGERAAQAVLGFGKRLAGPYGEQSVRLAGQAIRGVALGVVVTALAQSLLGGLGLVVCGVPFAPVLTAVMLVLAIAQIGPIPVLLASVVWLYWGGATGWGTVLLIWTVVVGTMDNFLRPFLIKKGADLPLLLIFAGVIGGLMAFGIIGIFIGPVVLAVAYTLTAAWVEGATAESGTPNGEIGKIDVTPGAKSRSIGENSPGEHPSAPGAVK
ncbi:MAG: AI-2E family transporter YdiK [Desulfobacterota bacterium]|nr:AI-2E family transporter YdiK [Thermodesulfobacteriota bacterium]